MHATAKRCGTREEADAEIANYAKTRHHRAGGDLQLRPENPKRETAREERDGEIAIRGVQMRVPRDLENAPRLVRSIDRSNINY